MKKIVSIILAIVMIAITAIPVVSATESTKVIKASSEIYFGFVDFKEVGHAQVESVDTATGTTVSLSATKDININRGILRHIEGDKATLSVKSTSFKISYVEFVKGISSIENVRIAFDEPKAEQTIDLDIEYSQIYYNDEFVDLPRAIKVGYSFECETLIKVNLQNGSTVAIDEDTISDISFESGVRTTYISTPDEGYSSDGAFVHDGINVTNSKDGVWCFRGNDGDTVTFDVNNMGTYLKKIHYVYSQHPSANYTTSFGVMSQVYNEGSFKAFDVVFEDWYVTWVDFTCDGYSFGQSATIEYYDAMAWLTLTKTDGSKIEFCPNNIESIEIETVRENCGITVKAGKLSIEKNFPKIVFEDGGKTISIFNDKYSYGEFNIACQHKHIYDEYVYNNDATCIKDGTKTAYCTVCGNAKTVEAEGTKTAHTFGRWETITEATCIENGLKSRICLVCGKEETDVIDALGHDDITIVTNLVIPTCTEKGGYDNTRLCMRCGKKEFINHVDMRAYGHNIIEVTNPATCIADGSIERYCLDCDFTETITIEKTGHINTYWTVVKEATEDEEGLKVKKCACCNETLEEETIAKLPKTEPETESTTTTDETTTNAHTGEKDGNSFLDFIRMIINAILKLFGR